jgi:hypothetical protein
MSVAAIVVSYNSARQLARCLPRLLAAGADVIVVDNASCDGSAELVARDFPSVRLLANAANVGFGRAVNQGLAATDADVILLVNPDCEVPPETVNGLVDFLREQSDVGVVGPRLLTAEGDVAISAHPFESAWTVLCSRFGAGLLPVGVRRLLSGGGRRRMYDACRDGRGPAAADWLSGACLAVRGDLLRSLGGLDDGYFMYYEDEELCLQAGRAGALVVYLPWLEARHVGGASSSDPAQVWPHLYRSMLRFHARHRPRTRALVRLLVALRALLGLVLALVRRRPRHRRAWSLVLGIALREHS